MNLFTALALFSVLASVLSFECGKNTCQIGETCCPGKRENEWHCCPFQMAKCCDNGEYCCPQFSTCSEEMGRCVIPMIPHHFEKRMGSDPQSDQGAHENLNKVLDHNEMYIQCDLDSYCLEGYTCCPAGHGKYTCAPYQNAVCCPDPSRSCQPGERCVSQSAYCLGEGDDVVQKSYDNDGSYEALEDPKDRM
ncbi:hypothetical protein CEXT_524991 [Caerostris extrusa]|uniref:Granulins domain-containing protein n=1 Tax=Caerostris extrusa TaxID=172846 RepID=A0AAV4SIQ5_CAEEX|nr:hypothetical protein CEXT_524991 [Caerostris extrusa]